MGTLSPAHTTGHLILLWSEGQTSWEKWDFSNETYLEVLCEVWNIYWNILIFSLHKLLTGEILKYDLPFLLVLCLVLDICLLVATRPFFSPFSDRFWASFSVTFWHTSKVLEYQTHGSFLLSLKCAFPRDYFSKLWATRIGSDIPLLPCYKTFNWS